VFCVYVCGVCSQMPCYEVSLEVQLVDIAAAKETLEKFSFSYDEMAAQTRTLRSNRSVYQAQTDRQRHRQTN